MNNHELKLQTKKKLNGQEIENQEVIEDFVRYINAYCAELKFTECDILDDDEHFEKVVNIYLGIRQ